MNLDRAAKYIGRYGVRKGISMYLDIKFKRLSKIRVPGIKETIFLRKDTSDVAIFEQVFLRGDYDLEFKFRPQTVVDAGANIGLFSILMKNKFPAAKIICIEPEKNNYETLNKNLTGYNNIETLQAGLWNNITRLEIVDRYNAGHSALTVVEKEEGSIPSITMGSLMDRYRLNSIDVLKIDIEACEKEVFLKNYELWLPKIRMIIIELHDWLEPGCSKVFFEAINRSFFNYASSVCGENIVIENKEFNSS